MLHQLLRAPLLQITRRMELHSRSIKTAEHFGIRFLDRRKRRIHTVAKIIIRPHPIDVRQARTSAPEDTVSEFLNSFRKLPITPVFQAQRLKVGAGDMSELATTHSEHHIVARLHAEERC